MVGILGLQELRKGADDDLKRVNGEGNVAKAVLTIVESHKARLASLREHVEGLVKSGGGSMADLELVAAGIRAMEEFDTADAKKVANAVVTGTAAEADAEAIAEPEGEADGETDREADGEAKPEA